MKALQIVQPREFRIVELPRPTAEADEVVVQVEYAAMCNQNDTKIFYGMYGDLIKYPCDPGVYGHEGVGIVTEVGAEVKDLSEGDRVLLMLDGGPMIYREYVERKADTVVRIDKKVSAEEAAPVELFGCAHHCMGIAGNLSGKTVALSGLGPAGLAILQLMKAVNMPKEIVGVEISEARAKAGREMGISRIVNPSVKEEMEALVAEGADVVIDATGAPQGILNAFEITRREVVIFGFTNEPFEVDQSKWFMKEMVIKNSKVQTIEDLRAVARLLEAGRIQTKPFITDIMSYEEYDKAVERLYKKEAIKILLAW